MQKRLSSGPIRVQTSERSPILEDNKSFEILAREGRKDDRFCGVLRTETILRMKLSFLAGPRSDFVLDPTGRLVRLWQTQPWRSHPRCELRRSIENEVS